MDPGGPHLVGGCSIYINSAVRHTSRTSTPHVAQRQMSSTPRVATHGGRPAAILDLHNDTQIGTLVGFGTRTGGMSPVPL